MPNIKSVQKDVIKSRKNHLRNVSAKSAMKTFIKKAKNAVDTDAESNAAVEAIRVACSAIDKTAERGIIHRNQASRRKSRLMKRAYQATRPTQQGKDTLKNTEANTVEAILDQAWLAEGLSSEELYEAKRMAEIEGMLLAAGHDLETLYQEWGDKTSAQIIVEYAAFSRPSKAKEPTASALAEWLPAVFERLISKSVAGKTGKWLVLHVSALLAGGETWKNDLEIPLTDKQARDFAGLSTGVKLSVRLTLHFRAEQIHAELIDFRLLPNSVPG